MTRGSIEIPTEMQPSALELALARKYELSKRYGALNDQIVEAKAAYRTERIRIQSFPERGRRKAAFIVLSQQLDEKLQPLYRTKGRIRVELADLTLTIKNEDIKRQRESGSQRQTRREEHEKYMQHLRCMMELPEDDVRALTTRALVAFRRLKDGRLLLPDECKLIPLLDDFVRKSQPSGSSAH